MIIKPKCIYMGGCNFSVCTILEWQPLFNNYLCTQKSTRDVECVFICVLQNHHQRCLALFFFIAHTFIMMMMTVRLCNKCISLYVFHRKTNNSNHTHMKLCTLMVSACQPMWWNFCLLYLFKYMDDTFFFLVQSDTYTCILKYRTTPFPFNYYLFLTKGF